MRRQLAVLLVPLLLLASCDETGPDTTRSIPASNKPACLVVKTFEASSQSGNPNAPAQNILETEALVTGLKRDGPLATSGTLRANAVALVKAAAESNGDKLANELNAIGVTCSNLGYPPVPQPPS